MIIARRLAYSSRFSTARHAKHPIKSFVKTIETKPEKLKDTIGYLLRKEDFDAAKVNPQTPIIQKALSLQYASQEQIKKHNIHEAIKTFGRAINDTGSAEVQAAILTVKIKAIEEHCASCKHDYTSERKLVEFKDRRRKILAYLKRVCLKRHYECLEKLELPTTLCDPLPEYPEQWYKNKNPVPFLERLKASKEKKEAKRRAKESSAKKLNF